MNTLTRILITLGALLSLVNVSAADQVEKTVKIDDKLSMTYTITTPDKFDLKSTAPVLIVFGPGPQTSEMSAYMRQKFTNECMSRGWILITPTPPSNTTFVNSPAYFKPLIDDLDKQVVAEGGKYHVAGPSNGGTSAVAFALYHPDRAASVTGFPATIIKDKYDEKTDAPKLKGIRMRLWVGGDDTLAWINAARDFEALADRHKLDIKVVTVPRENHMIRSLETKTIMDELEAGRNAAGTITREQRDVLSTLDSLHAAASKADEKAYFDLFAPESVFIGTDATERWTLDQFKAYAHPIMSKGKGWTYVPQEGTRFVTISADKSVAWFDEMLRNDKLGTTRGNGVMVRNESTQNNWRIAHYHLAIPIPNAIAERVAKMVKAEDAKKKSTP